MSNIITAMPITNIQMIALAMGIPSAAMITTAIAYPSADAMHATDRTKIIIAV